MFENSKTSIRVHTTFEGLHKYPNAPIEVEDLRDLHRHIFHVRVQLTVTHLDREIEFFLLKHDVEQAIDKDYPKQNGVHNLGACSCEMIAQTIYRTLYDKYHLNERDVVISVSEDDNNEGILEVPRQA